MFTLSKANKNFCFIATIFWLIFFILYSSFNFLTCFLWNLARLTFNSLSFCLICLSVKGFLFFLPKVLFFYTGSAFFEAFLAAFCYLAIFFFSSLTKFYFISAILSSITFLAASATFLALISSMSLLIRAVSLACLSSYYLKGTNLAYFFSRAFNFFIFLCSFAFSFLYLTKSSYFFSSFSFFYSLAIIILALRALAFSLFWRLRASNFFMILSIWANGANGFEDEVRLLAWVEVDELEEEEVFTDLRFCFFSFFSSSYFAFFSFSSSCFLFLASYCLRIDLIFQTFLVC